LTGSVDARVSTVAWKFGLLMASRAPVIVNAVDFGLVEGIKKLREIPKNGCRINRSLKKPFHGLLQRRNRKMRFPGSFIFNDLPSSKMAVPPCTAHKPLKNAIFQRPVNN